MDMGGIMNGNGNFQLGGKQKGVNQYDFKMDLLPDT